MIYKVKDCLVWGKIKFMDVFYREAIEKQYLNISLDQFNLTMLELKEK